MPFIGDNPALGFLDSTNVALLWPSCSTGMIIAPCRGADQWSSSCTRNDKCHRWAIPTTGKRMRVEKVTGRRPDQRNSR